MTDDRIPYRNAPYDKVSSVGETIDIEEYIAMTDLPVEDHVHEPSVLDEEMPSTDVDSEMFESTIDEDGEEEEDEDEDTDDEDEEEEAE